MRWTASLQLVGSRRDEHRREKANNQKNNRKQNIHGIRPPLNLYQSLVQKAKLSRMKNPALAVEAPGWGGCPEEN